MVDMTEEELNRRQAEDEARSSKKGGGRGEKVKETVGKVKGEAMKRGKGFVERGSRAYKGLRENMKQGSDFREGWRTGEAPRKPVPGERPGQYEEVQRNRRGRPSIKWVENPKSYTTTASGEAGAALRDKAHYARLKAYELGGKASNIGKGLSGPLAVGQAAYQVEQPVLTALQQYTAAAGNPAAQAQIMRDRGLDYTGKAFIDSAKLTGEGALQGLAEFGGNPFYINSMLGMDPGYTAPTYDKYISTGSNAGKFADVTNDMYYTVDDKGNRTYDINERVGRLLGDTPGGAYDQQGNQIPSVKAAVGTPGHWGRYTSMEGPYQDVLGNDPTGEQGPRFSKNAAGQLVINDDYGVGKENVTVTPEAAGIRGAYRIDAAGENPYFTDRPGSGAQQFLDKPMTKNMVDAMDNSGRSEMEKGKYRRAIEAMTPQERLAYKEQLRGDRKAEIALAREEIELDKARTGAKYDSFRTARKLLEDVGGVDMANKYALALSSLDPNQIQDEHIMAMPMVDRLINGLKSFQASGTWGEWLAEKLPFADEGTGQFGEILVPEFGAKHLQDLYNAFRPGGSGELEGVGGRTLTMGDMDPQTKQVLAAIINAMDVAPVRNLIDAMAKQADKKPTGVRQ